MPDWSYHPLKKVVIDHLPVHKGRTFLLKSMNTVSTIPGGKNLIQFLGHMHNADVTYKCPSLNQTFSSPVGLSCKVDPYSEGTMAFQHLGFGLIEIGPVTIHNTTQKNAPLKKDNRLYLPEEKIDLRKLLPTLINKKITKPLLIRIDPSISSSELLNVLVSTLLPYTNCFVISESQLQMVPKIAGLHYFVSINADELHNAVKISNLCTGIVLQATRKKEGIYTTKKTGDTDELINAINLVKRKFPNTFIITSGGMNEPTDGLKLLDAGAHILLCEEEYVQNGPGLPKRINELISARKQKQDIQKDWKYHFLFGLSIFIAGMIATIFAFTTVILSYDEHFIGLSREALQSMNPNILLFMEHDRMSLAGTMISAGLIYMALSYFGIRRNLHWAKVAFHSAAISGFVGILLFIGYGYFDWLHGLFWLLLLPIYLLSWKEGKAITGSPYSIYGQNTKDWIRGIYGQTLFVLLGGLLLVGGIVISTIGITTIFVETDIQFICMPPEMLQEISNTLLPVIAHDRAGFGSALISVGILVLCTALWGYRAGEKWLWWTFAIGALPAFIAGVGTHFAIGYTSFIHILPLYFLILVYLAGLVLSYEYLVNPKKNA